MSTQDQIDYIMNVFETMVAENEEKLNIGVSRRADIAKRLEAGEEVVTYRTRWIRDTASKIVDVLKMSSIEFNSKYDDDRISTLDLVDVVATVDGLLRGKIK